MQHIHRVVNFHPSIVLLMAFFLTLAITITPNILVSTGLSLVAIVLVASANHRLRFLHVIDTNKLGAGAKLKYQVSATFVIVSLITIIAHGAYDLASTYSLVYFNPGADMVLNGLMYINPFLLFGAIGASGRIYGYVMKHDWLRDEIESQRRDRTRHRRGV